MRRAENRNSEYRCKGKGEGKAHHSFNICPKTLQGSQIHNDATYISYFCFYQVIEVIVRNLIKDLVVNLIKDLVVIGEGKGYIL